MRGDAPGVGLPADVFPAVDPRPADGSPEVSRVPEACPRLAVWPQVAWFLVAWLRDLPVARGHRLRAFRHLHHLQVEQEVDWRSVARDAYWVTGKHLA